eukprot:1195873-Prorocentrum_minimum.AAC.3
MQRGHPTCTLAAVGTGTTPISTVDLLNTKPRRSYYATHVTNCDKRHYRGRRYTPHLRNTFDSAATHLVRVEVYRYSKGTIVRHGSSGAAVFAAFSPASSDHTLRTFRAEAGERPLSGTISLADRGGGGAVLCLDEREVRVPPVARQLARGGYEAHLHGAAQLATHGPHANQAPGRRGGQEGQEAAVRRARALRQLDGESTAPALGGGVYLDQGPTAWREGACTWIRGQRRVGRGHIPGSGANGV